MKSRRAIIAAFFLILVIFAVYELGPLVWNPEKPPGEYNQTAQSDDLPRDVKRMWETQPLPHSDEPPGTPARRASTDRAINAASRVFNTAELIGKTPHEAAKILGDPRTSSDSMYNFPFFPPGEKAVVYRFDCGSYGWQFNLLLGDDGKFESVKRIWIY